MNKRFHKSDSPEDQDEALEALLHRASKAVGEDEEGSVDLKRLSGEPLHRWLRVVVSADRLEARLEAVFPDTTFEEVLEALRRERVVWGIQEDTIREALEKAERSGRHQRDVPAAKGRPAVYRKRQEVSYPFLEGLKDPETGEPVHPISSAFREIVEVMGRTDIEMIRGYGRPVVAAAPGETLMVVQGEDEIAPGQDVFGREIRRVEGKESSSLKAGEGVDLQQDGSLIAYRFGYISTVGGYLSVVSPIWISMDRMEAYFVNPPQLGERKVPDPEAVQRGLEELGVTFGIDGEAIGQMCQDLCGGGLRESCVLIARGRRPNLAKGQIGFTFEPVPEARFEGVRDAFQTVDLANVTGCTTQVHAVHGGTVLAEQGGKGNDVGPGKDLFGEPVAPPEEVQDRKAYKAGINVRREEEEGCIRYVSEIYGYVGVLENRIMVVSPIWISPDKMAACFVALPQHGERPVLPDEAEVDVLLHRARVRHGMDREAIEMLCRALPAGGDPEDRAVLLARGTPPEPGHDGRVELLFKQMPDPGNLLERNKMDFRERDAVPQVHTGELLARRMFPTPGKPGTDVRGKVLKAPRSERELLYAGPNVIAEEQGEEQLFYATGSGWARVVKDTLGVMQRFQHRGNVDYRIGHIQMEGDVEIEGTVKSRFKVEATGDVYISGFVERGGKVAAGGNVVVKGGIIGAKVKAGGSLYAHFIQDSEVEIGVGLMVRNYVQESQVEVYGKATVQGNEGGERQLCLLGGTLVATSEVDTVSIGSAYGRQTRVVVGVDPEVESRLEKYQKGLAFSHLRSRRAMRTVETAISGKDRKKDLAAAIRQMPPGRREFLTRQLKEMETLKKLKVSLKHHSGDLEKVQTEIAGRAQIRVPGSAFQKVTVQIGKVYKELEEEVRRVVFHLNREGTQIAQELL